MAITLNGKTDYDSRFAPKNAKKGYVARINGMADSALQFDREFLGSSATITESGLYEVQTGLKKGGFDRVYRAILLVNSELVCSAEMDAEDATIIRRRMDKGEAIESIVGTENLRPSKRLSGVTIFDHVILEPVGKLSPVELLIKDFRDAYGSIKVRYSVLPEEEQQKVRGAILDMLGD